MVKFKTRFAELSIDHEKEVTLNGEFSANTLCEKLIDEWIPYIDCERKCYKSNYCKFTEPHKYVSGRLNDIKCGVAKNALENIIKFSWNDFVKLERKEQENLLNAYFHIVHFIIGSEMYIGQLCSDSFFEDMDSFATQAIGITQHLRGSLDKSNYYMSKVKSVHIEQAIIYVEGESELAFLNTLSHYLLSKRIKTYKGKTNLNNRKPHLLMEEILSRGDIAYIQGDLDGAESCNLNNLVTEKKLQEKQIFTFEHDFESSIPLPILYLSLFDMDLIGNLSYEDFSTPLSADSKSEGIAKKINQHHNIDISKAKVELAINAGKLCNYPFRSNDDSLYIGSELFRFVFWATHGSHDYKSDVSYKQSINTLI